MTRTAITAIHPALITPSTTGIAISPALEPTQHSPDPRPDPEALAAAAAEGPLERRELVCPGGDRHHAGCGRPVRPAGREHHRTGQGRDRQVRPGEPRYDAHAAGAGGSRHGRGRARQHHRHHHRHPGTHEGRERAEPGRHPMSIPVICQTETTQHAAASPSVAVSAAAAVLAAVMAGARVVGASGLQARPLGDGAPARPR